MEIMDQDEKKLNEERAALKYIHNDCILGMGTGSTVNYLIDLIPSIKNKITSIASSSIETERLLRSHGFDVLPLNEIGSLDLYIDGADEATKNLHLIKGGGGALTREKIIAAASEKFVCIADESKLIHVLGKFPLPVEVVPMSRSYVAREIVKLGGQPVYREGFVTDNSNVILDVHGWDIMEPISLEKTLNNIVGVVNQRLFAMRPADVLLLGSEDGTKVITNK